MELVKRRRRDVSKHLTPIELGWARTPMYVCVYVCVYILCIHVCGCGSETLREPGREDTGNHSVCCTAYLLVSTSTGMFHWVAGVYCLPLGEVGLNLPRIPIYKLYSNQIYNICLDAVSKRPVHPGFWSD